mmetsp:Transcript_23698/g.55862  ORF Transcript_23698/g.55862 Transcript_23698/m.55862 type:complete len:244 (-) Transcript_23698:1203-1934(-)
MLHQLPLASGGTGSLLQVDHDLHGVLHHLLHQRACHRRRVVAGRRRVDLNEPHIGCLALGGFADHEVITKELDRTLAMLDAINDAHQRPDDDVLHLLSDAVPQVHAWIHTGVIVADMLPFSAWEVVPRRADSRAGIGLFAGWLFDLHIDALLPVGDAAGRPRRACRVRRRRRRSRGLRRFRSGLVLTSPFGWHFRRISALVLRFFLLGRELHILPPHPECFAGVGWRLQKGRAVLLTGAVARM